MSLRKKQVPISERRKFTNFKYISKYFVRSFDASYHAVKQWIVF